MTAALPPVTWPLTTGETITVPWHSYFKAADDAWRVPVTVYTSTSDTATTLVPNNGLTVISLNATHAATTWNFEGPEAGVRKVILCSNTSLARLVTPSTVIKVFFGTGSGWYINFPAAATDKLVELIGMSTFQWLVVSNPSSATFTTV
jgi:hypothetical protein